MSTKKESRKSKKNKVSGKNKPNNNPRAATISKIKAQAEARREAESKELQEQKEWEEEQERLEQERLVEEEIKKEEKRLTKERRDAEKFERKKKKVSQAMLAKRMKIYGIGTTRTKSRLLSSDNNFSPVVSTTEASETPETFKLRSPIICVLGHVDVGKTKLLDYLRQTHVQDNEAGGITQQIGSSFFPISEVRKTIEKVGSNRKIEFGVPGLLVVDTPGHESFVNLRSRGTGICDFAILVVDLLAGLEQQTIESINLLKLRKTPFVIALNKVDLIYEWKSNDGGSSAQNYKKQSKDVQQTFDNLTNRILVQMAEQGLNARVYWKNRNLREMISMVPTSAHTGEGVPDLLMMITQMVQRFLSKKVSYSDNFEATILEVKPIPGLGTTIDVILVNGTLKRGDNIVLCGINGPITTTVKDILTTQPMKELRIKSPYIHHNCVRAAQGVKILSPGHDLAGAVSIDSIHLSIN